MSRYTPYLFFFAAVALFLYPVMDPDFWWHVKVGEYIVTTKSIPYIDWMSFSMEGYAYVFHSWLTEVLLYLSHTLAGLWGVSIFYATLLAIGLYFSAVTANLSRTKAFGVALFFAPFVFGVVAIRTQVTTYVLLTILFYLLMKAPHITKVDKGFFRWLLSNNFLIVLPLFILWSNLHGGVMLGLVLLGAYLAIIGVTGYFATKDLQAFITFTLFSVLFFLLCIVCTGFNPYGFGQVTQAVAMQTNTTALAQNPDWYPLFRHKRGLAVGFFRDILIASLGVIGLLSARYAKDVVRARLLVGAVFLLCFVTMRFGLLLLVVATPFLISGAYNGIHALRKNMFAYRLSLGCASLILVGSFSFHFSETFCANLDERCYLEITSGTTLLPNYPDEAATYMQEHGVPSRLLNGYSHGGYLYYKFPGHQFFIDGRMDNFFKDERSFAEEYVQLLNTKDGWEEKFNYYQFNGYLGEKSRPIVHELLGRGWRWVVEEKYYVLLLPPNV